MGTHMHKIPAVLLLSLSVGLLGGTPAFGQSCVDFIKKMKTTAPTIGDETGQKEFQRAISKAERQLQEFQYMDCVGTSRKALSTVKAK